MLPVDVENIKRFLKNNTSNFKTWGAFALGVVILACLVTLFFYQSVASEVNKTSRCKLLKDRYTGSGVYTVEERSSNNTPLYAVSYNLSARKSEVQCMCPKGDQLNKFVFNERDLFNNKNKVTTLNCSCDDDYSSSISLTNPGTRVFNGYPELVNYMRDKRNDQFFRKPAIMY